MYQGVDNMKLNKVTVKDDNVAIELVNIPEYCKFLKNNNKESDFNDNGNCEGNRGGNEIKRGKPHLSE
jgi:hypothetical protein